MGHIKLQNQGCSPPKKKVKNTLWIVMIYFFCIFALTKSNSIYYRLYVFNKPIFLKYNN
jgi:hypothetical protein